jgi:hypothetical protein
MSSKLADFIEEDVANPPPTLHLITVLTPYCGQYTCTSTAAAPITSSKVCASILSIGPRDVNLQWLFLTLLQPPASSS